MKKEYQNIKLKWILSRNNNEKKKKKYWYFCCTCFGIDEGSRIPWRVQWSKKFWKTPSLGKDGLIDPICLQDGFEFRVVVLPTKAKEHILADYLWGHELRVFLLLSADRFVIFNTQIIIIQTNFLSLNK